MRKTLNYIVILAASFCIISCEKTEIVELDLSGDEYIVIRGEVSTGEIFSGVNITRTLPSGIKYDIKLAEIKDAYAYISINEKQVVPLHYISDGLYKPLYDLLVNEGDVYEFFAKINGKPVYAKTRAPFKPNVASVAYTSGHYFQAKIRPVEGQAYGAIWFILSGASAAATDYFSVVKPVPENPGALVDVRTEELPAKFQTKDFENSRYIIVTSFDKDYLDYFQTKGISGTSGNNFIQNGGPIKWNITGDKVIGLFIGVGKGSILPPF